MRAWWRELRAELAFLIGVTRLEARRARMPSWQVRDELAWLEARRREAKGQARWPSARRTR